MNTQQLDHTYIANTYARYPVTIVRGKGSLVWDENGKEYIDLATGIAVNSFGVSDPAWVRAVTEQLCTVQHTSNLYFTAPDAQLAQLLCEKTGMKKVFFSNSGAEANECAIKAARKRIGKVIRKGHQAVTGTHNPQLRQRCWHMRGRKQPRLTRAGSQSPSLF